VSGHKSNNNSDQTDRALAPEGDLMTVYEAAEYLNCSYRTLYQLVRNGDLPALRLGGVRLWRVRRSDFEVWISAGGSLRPKKGRGKGRPPAHPQDREG
jgi:excisionase family DNA binding protein